MQEEVTNGSVTLIINSAKMTEQVLEKALQKYLEAKQKGTSLRSTGASRP